MKHTFFEKFPCVIPDINIENILEKLVDNILLQSKHEYYEIINHKVYGLYDLTLDEIQIIENRNEI